MRMSRLPAAPHRVLCKSPCVYRRALLQPGNQRRAGLSCRRTWARSVRPCLVPPSLRRQKVQARRHHRGRLRPQSKAADSAGEEKAAEAAGPPSGETALLPRCSPLGALKFAPRACGATDGRSPPLPFLPSGLAPKCWRDFCKQGCLAGKRCPPPSASSKTQASRAARSAFGAPKRRAAAGGESWGTSRSQPICRGGLLPEPSILSRSKHRQPRLGGRLRGA